jgi:multidrug efflux system outer membrane protein
MRGLRLVAGALLLAFGSACAVGPNYVRPPVDAPGEHRSQVGAVEAASLADLPWWEVFEDEVLQQLILDALISNHDLQAAVQRVAQAKAQVGVAQSPFYPQIGYQGSAGRQRDPRFQGQSGDEYSLFFGVFSLAWELDVWGRIRRSNEARSRLFATEESAAASC